MASSAGGTVASASTPLSGDPVPPPPGPPPPGRGLHAASPHSGASGGRATSLDAQPSAKRQNVRPRVWQSIAAHFTSRARERPNPPTPDRDPDHDLDLDLDRDRGPIR